MSRKPYKRKISKTTWFLRHSRFQHYMLHEITSIFLAIYLVILITGLFRLGQGPIEWQGWLDGVTSWIGVPLASAPPAGSMHLPIARSVPSALNVHFCASVPLQS